MASQRSHVRWTIERIKEHTQTRRKDRIVVEEPLLIRIASGIDEQAFDLSVTMRTPGHDFDLITGFLYAESLIESAADIRSMSYCVGSSETPQYYNTVRVDLAENVSIPHALFKRNFVTHSSCGVCGQSSIDALHKTKLPVLQDHMPRVSIDCIYSLSQQLKEAQSIFSHTGGVHAAALFTSKGERLAIREDVGRHNALDKLIGQQLIAQQFPLQDTILLMSSRGSFELVQKAIRSGIPIVAFIGAPSSLAVQLAEEYQITLIGFLRERRCNIYAAEQRIEFPFSPDL